MSSPRLKAACLLWIFGIVTLLAGCAGHHGGGGGEHNVTQREVEIRLDLAEAYLRNNEPRLALQELNLIQSQAQVLPRFHFTLGYTWLVLGNAAEAAAAFRKAVELDPDYAEAWNNLGLALLFSNQFEAAEQAFTSALAVPTSRTPEVAALNLARLHIDRDQPDAALRFAHLALGLNRRFTEAYLVAAELELARGNAEDAVALLKRGAKANLDAPHLLLALAEYLILAGQPNQAMAWLDRLQTSAPDSPEAAIALEYQISLQRQSLLPQDSASSWQQMGTGQPKPPLVREHPAAHDSTSDVTSDVTSDATSIGSPAVESSRARESLYIVQVGAFLSRARAETMRDAFRSKMYPAEISEIQHKNKTWHVVFIASTRERKEAKVIAERFTEREGVTPAVVRIGQGRYLEIVPP